METAHLLKLHFNVLHKCVCVEVSQASYQMVSFLMISTGRVRTYDHHRTLGHHFLLILAILLAPESTYSTILIFKFCIILRNSRSVVTQ